MKPRREGGRKFTFDVDFALRLIAFDFTSELSAVVLAGVLDLQDAAVLSSRNLVLARSVLQHNHRTHRGARLTVLC